MSCSHMNVGEYDKTTGLLLFCCSAAVAMFWQRNRPCEVSVPIASPLDRIGSSTLDQLIGSTPLIKLEQLSILTGCEIYAKMESLNPSGTGKDRAVQSMLRSARLHPNFGPGVRLVEGTSGSTGIALAFQCNALKCDSNVADSSRSHRNVQLHVVMPDDQAEEKRALLEKLGAKVLVTACCSISNKDHYVNRARRLAQELDAEGYWEEVPESKCSGSGSDSVTTSTTTTARPQVWRRRVKGAIFLDQFENEANFRAHYEGTGPEIWKQLGLLKGGGGDGNKESGHCKRLDAFVMSAGTGGTIAGVARYLKEQDPSVQVLLADPTGSSLLHKVTHGVCYAVQQSERTLRRHRYDSVVEGVGLDRVTANFQLGLQAGLDGGFHIPDQEVVETAHWLLRNEGLFVGSSSALNVAAVVRAAHQLQQRRGREGQAGEHGEGRKVRVVTVICDSGSRHLSRLWNPVYIKEQYNLTWPEEDCVPACLQLFSQR